MRHALLGSVATLIACSTSANAATIILQQGVNDYAGHLDVMVRNDTAANQDVSSNTALNVAGKVPAGVLRNLHTWDLSAIPAGAQITSVTLTLQHRSDSGASLDDTNTIDDASDPLFEIRTISAPIVEPAFSPGGTATGSGSDWLNTFGGGMTLGSAVLSSANVDPEIGGSLLDVVFGSTQNFIDAVQAAVDSQDKLLSFAIKLSDETLGDRIVASFGSNTGNIAGLGTDGNPNRPILTIEYVPEPASLGVLAVAGSLALVRRRRQA
jgi:hypothetical protein